MGIEGLLGLLKPSTTPIKIGDLTGSVIGVDASCWLYPGAMACSVELCRREPTTMYIKYFKARINYLINHDVSPIVVFDGFNTLPAKRALRMTRNKEKAHNLERGFLLLKEGNEFGAKMAFNRAVAITMEMVNEVITVLKEMNVDYIIAPYEADAQLAYLAKSGIIQYVLTEDSDLLVFGTPRVIYKFDIHTGSGILIEQRNLFHSFPNLDFNFEKFQMMCVLSGCDYLQSIPGIGLKRAKLFLKAVEGQNAIQEIPNIAAHINRNVTVPAMYARNLEKALNVFAEQVVYDPVIASYTRVQGQEILSDDVNYSGLIPETPPIMCFDNSVISLSFLNVTDISDTSYKVESDVSMTDLLSPPMTRQRYANSLQLRVLKVNNAMSWTIPEFPVLTINFLKGLGNIDGVNNVQILFNAEDTAILQADTPFELYVTKFCEIVVDNTEYTVIWKWEFIYTDYQDNGSDCSTSSLCLSSSSCPSTSSSSPYSTISEAEGEDVYVPNQEDNTYSVDNPHTLSFKVMGVTFSDLQQRVLQYLKLNPEVQQSAEVSLCHEPFNPYDKNAVGVFIYTEQFGKVRIGYITKELTQYVLPFISVLKCRIGTIFYKLNWYRPGHYMSLIISKPSKWHEEVMRRSLRVR